jgi:DNA-binding NarL/FixJ family response regulator
MMSGWVELVLRCRHARERRCPKIVRLATVFGLGQHATMKPVRPTVLIVDDHEAFRESARVLLEADGFDVIGESEDGGDALDAVASLRPQVVLVDIQLPGLDGFALAERLAERVDPPAVVLISSRDAAAYGSRLRDTPSRGFIPKSELSGEALAALID